MGHEGVKDAALDVRQVFVEVVFEAGHGDAFANGAEGENSVQERLLVGLQLGPLGAVFLQDEVVVLVMDEAEHAVVLMLLDDQVAAHGKIDDGGGDVAHVGGVIDERAGFAGSELIRRLVLRGDGTKTRIAAAGPPQIKHDDESGQRQTQRPIAAEEKAGFVDRRRLMDETFVESHGDGQSFVIAERVVRANFNAIGCNFHARAARRRAIGAGEDIGADVGGAFGKNNARAGGLDGDVPLVAGNVPIELVVILEETQGVGNGVFNGDGLRGVVGIGDVNLELAIVAYAAGLEFEAVAVGVGDGFDVEKQRVIKRLRCDVFDRDAAVQAVPRPTDKMDLDIFGDVDRTARRDHNLRVEFLDPKLFAGE